MGTPNIGGTTTGSVFEDSGAIVTGDLDDIGFNTANNDDTWSISGAASYGTATINPTTGAWTYDLDDNNPVVDALDAGQTLTDTFTVRMVDNGGFGAGQSDTQVITITINGVPCLVRGSMIETEHGLRPINTIRTGDRIVTQDGLKVVRWIGRRKIMADELSANPKLHPVRIMAGALGNGLPRHDLLVSRQHRMLVQSAIAHRMFGSAEVFIPAIKLTELPGIYLDQTIETVEYFHLLFDRHEVIFAEGAPTESLFTGPEALNAISEDARDEICTLFPEITKLDYAPETARYVPSGPLQKQLIARHLKNNKPLLCPAGQTCAGSLNVAH